MSTAHCHRYTLLALGQAWMHMFKHTMRTQLIKHAEGKRRPPNTPGSCPHKVHHHVLGRASFPAVATIAHKGLQNNVHVQQT